MSHYNRRRELDKMKVELDLDKNYKGVIEYMGKTLDWDFDQMCTYIIKNWVHLLKKGMVNEKFTNVLKELDKN
jgi:hypothetical protein